MTTGSFRRAAAASRPSRKRAASVVRAVVLLFLLCAGGAVRAEEQTVRLFPHWAKGEKVRFELERTREKTESGRTSPKTTSRTDVEIEVLSAAEDAFVLAWTAGETRVDGAAMPEDPAFRRVANLFADLRVVLEVDRAAQIRAVRNWEELRAAATKGLRALCDEMKSAGADAATVEKVRGQVESLFADRKRIELACTRDPGVLFTVLGVEFEDGEPVEVDGRLPNPFGGEPFPCRTRAALVEVDRKLGTATVEFTRSIPPEEARRIMDATLKDAAKRLGRPVPRGDVLRTLTIDDRATFRVEIASGWARSLTFVRTTRTDESREVETVVLTRKSGAAPPPKPAADFPDDENGEVLRRLAQAGDDLTKPRDVNFEFAFGGRKDVDAFAAEVGKTLGLVSKVWLDDESGEWAATVTKNMVPTHAEITRLEKALADLAKSHGGESLGWGCAVVEKAK